MRSGSMTIKQVASYLGKSQSAIYKMIKEQRGVGKEFVYIPGQGYTFEGELKDDE